MKSYLTSIIKDRLIVTFVLILIISSLIRIVPILYNNFPFTMDQGRDMLDIRDIVVGKNPTLIGPTTSINGVFLGPFYYYFNAIPFLFSMGDPAFLVYWTLLLYISSSVALFVYFLKDNPKFALLVSVISLSIPQSFYSSRYSWNANPMPPFTIFYFLALFAAIKKPSFLKASLVGVLCGIGLQIEAAFGVLLFPFALLVLLYKKVHWKIILATLIPFVASLLPQILFELRNNFLMTKIFFGELSGSGSILINKLNLNQTFTSHYNSYLEIISKLSDLPGWFNILILLCAVITAFALIRFKSKGPPLIYTLLPIFFILFSYLFYLFYKYDLKGWYIHSLYVPAIFILAYALNFLLNSKNKAIAIFGGVIFLSLIFSSHYHQYQIMPKDLNYQSGDPSNLKNLLSNIDWVYQKASGSPFKVYTYVPSVYDFSNQYLFWWHGTKTYGYHPADISYLPNVPEYIKDNHIYWDKTKPVNSDNLTFLIIEKDKEMPVREHAWLGSFTHLCLVETKMQPWNIEIQIRKECQK